MKHSVVKSGFLGYCGFYSWERTADIGSEVQGSIGCTLSLSLRLKLCSASVGQALLVYAGL